MNIPSPVALPGEKVEIFNYRKKPGAWEIGTCTGVSYAANTALPKWRWSYDAVLDRSGGKTRITLSVGDDGIRRAKEDA